MDIKLAETPEIQNFIKGISGANSDAGDPRMQQILHRLMQDLFRLIDDLDVSTEEFWQAVNYVNELGTSKETALLAAGLGVEHYFDLRLDAAEEAAGRLGGTPRTIEGPLYVAGAPYVKHEARLDDGRDDGEVLWLHGRVRDDSGKPVAGAVVDVWHADSKGNYSYFDSSQSEYNLRRRIETDSDGRYRARSIVPSGYGCPPAGPTQRLLDEIGRHGKRPAHIHFFVSAPGHVHLTTQINLADDDLLHEDFAFATREELIAQVKRIDDAERAESLGLPGPFAEIEFDFELTPAQDSAQQSRARRPRALETQDEARVEA